jgi:hypothetical protein
MRLLGIYLVTAFFSFLGYCGGTWLWEEFALSQIFSKIRRYVKGVGILALSGCTIIFLLVGSVHLNASENIQVDHIKKVLLPCLSFFLGYMIGYDLVLILLFKPLNPGKYNDDNIQFHINWSLLYFSVMLTITFSSLYYFSTLLMDPFRLLIGSSSLALAGGCIAVLFWSQLRQVASFPQPFFLPLLWMSLITTGYLIVIIGLVIQVLQNRWTGISLPAFFFSLEGFLACMIFYFIALLRVACKTQQESAQSSAP